MDENREMEEKILLERAKVLSNNDKQDQSQGNQKQLVAFLISGKGYAIEVSWVKEMLPLPKITPIPGVPSFILGAVNVRGNIVTLTDLEEFLEIGKLKEKKEEQKILVLESSKIQTGIIVDDVIDCLSIPEKQIEAPLVTLEEKKLEYILGQIRLKGKIFAFLDGKALLENSRLLIG